MNLLTFARTTAPWAFYAIPAVFGWGTVAHMIDGDTAVGFAVAFAGVALFLAYLLGTALHRQRLITNKLGRYIDWTFGNNERHGHPTPTRAVGAAYVQHAIENPTA